MGLVSLIDRVTLKVLCDITQSDIIPVTVATILLYYSTGQPPRIALFIFLLRS